MDRAGALRMENVKWIRDKDCAWEKINSKLEKQGRLEEFLNQPVQLRDYSKVNFNGKSEASIISEIIVVAIS